jgi:hypothetical protein
MKSLADIFNAEAAANGTAQPDAPAAEPNGGYRLSRRILTLSAAPDELKIHPDNVPDSILLFPWGTDDRPPFWKVNATTLDMVPKVQKAFGLLTMPINEENNTEQNPVATANVTVKEGEGLFLENIKWSDAGRTALAKEHIGYGTEIWVDGPANGIILGLRSVTLSRGGRSTFHLLPDLINLSALAAIDGYNRLNRHFNNENLRTLSAAGKSAGASALDAAGAEYDAMVRRASRP